MANEYDDLVDAAPAPAAEPLREDAGGNEYDALVDNTVNEDEARNQHLRLMQSYALNRDVGREANVLRIARAAGAHPTIIDAKLDEFAKLVDTEDFDPKRFRDDHPALAEMMFRKPELATLALKDDALKKFAAVGRP